VLTLALLLVLPGKGDYVREPGKCQVLT
jgi:hypothetical protein